MLTNCQSLLFSPTKNKHLYIIFVEKVTLIITGKAPNIPNYIENIIKVYTNGATDLNIFIYFCIYLCFYVVQS